MQGDENFLFVSVHVFDDKKAFFPGTGKDATEKDPTEKDESNKDTATAMETEAEPTQADLTLEGPLRTQETQARTQEAPAQPVRAQETRKKRKREDKIAAIVAAASAAAAAQETSNVLNVGLKRFSSSNSFIQAFKNRVIPRLDAYRPQIILISAGMSIY